MNRALAGHPTAPAEEEAIRLPWHRRYKFLTGCVLGLALYAAFLLPPSGRPQSLGAGLAIGTLAMLALAWVFMVLIDREKPDWLKSVAATGFIFLGMWLFYRYSGGDWAMLGQMFLNFPSMADSWDVLWMAFGTTLQLAALSSLFSPLIGLVLAILRSFHNKILDLFIIAYVDFFRAIPMLVLMVLVYFALPFVGVELPSKAAATVSLSMLYGAYAAEIFRAGIESVHRTQTEAARALGLSAIQTMRLVILPQAIRIVIPPLTGQMIGLIKDTSLASVIATPELMKKGRELYAYKKNITPLVAVAFIYLSVLLPLVYLSAVLERMVSEKWVKKPQRT